MPIRLSIEPIRLVRRGATDGGPRIVAVVPWPNGDANALTLGESGEVEISAGRLRQTLDRLGDAGFDRGDDAELPRRLMGALRDLVGEDIRIPPYHHAPTWSMHAAKRSRKGSERPPLRGSEKAWVKRAWPDKGKGAADGERPYLDFVRYMRWYAHRSYLGRRLNGWKHVPGREEFFASWPRWTP